MKNTYSIKELMESFDYESMECLLMDQSEQFENVFGFKPKENIELEVSFNSIYEMIDAYNELKFNKEFNQLYDVMHHPHKKFTILVSGQTTLFEYLGSREPNLLSLSRLCGINFKVRFEQEFSGSIFTGEVVNGELLARQCLVEVNDIVPALSLGLLKQIGKTEEEFDLLLTRIIPYQSVRIL